MTLLRQPFVLAMRESEKRSVILVLLLGLSMALVVAFYVAYTFRDRPGGGFARNIVPNVLTDSVIVALPFNSYYLAGTTGGNIYLGNETAPLHLLSVNDRQLINASIEVTDPMPRATRIRIDSPFFYLEDLERYSIRAGHLASLRVEGYAIQSAFFSEAIPLSPNSVVQRTISDQAQEYTLSKLTTREHTYQHGLLQKQVDGLFCTDGMLHYDKLAQRFTYVYFYRNQFICTDTCLNLEFRHNTIDTIRRARIEVAKLSEHDAMMLSTPPFIVNRRSTTFDNTLFVNSTILSDSESNEITQHNSIIDVYDLEEKGAYRYSFYLPHFQGRQMKHFMIYGDYLFSIHDRFLIRYTLKPIL